MTKHILLGMLYIYSLFGISLLVRYLLDIYYDTDVAIWVIESWLNMFHTDVLKFSFLTFGIPLLSTIIGMGLYSPHDIKIDY